MPTIADKASANAVLDGMVAEVRNRRGATGTVPATATAPATPTVELSGSVEQAREIITAHAKRLREVAAEMIEEATHLEYAMDLVFDTFTPGPAPVNVDEARKRAEAEADARQAAKREPASEEAIAEMMVPVLSTKEHVFVGESVPMVVGAGWTCPDHGKVITKHSRRTGRDYLACPVEGCIEIERRS